MNLTEMRLQNSVVFAHGSLKIWSEDIIGHLKLAYNETTSNVLLPRRIFEQGQCCWTSQRADLHHYFLTNGVEKNIIIIDLRLTIHKKT